MLARARADCACPICGMIFSREFEGEYLASKDLVYVLDKYLVSICQSCLQTCQLTDFEFYKIKSKNKKYGRGK